jgi:hypothetical protein
VRAGDWKLIRRYAHAPGKAAGEKARLVLIGEELYDLAREIRTRPTISRRIRRPPRRSQSCARHCCDSSPPIRASPSSARSLARRRADARAGRRGGAESPEIAGY